MTRDAPAAAASRAVSCPARAARACGQPGAAASGNSAGPGTVRPASASLAAQAGPASAIRTASRARVAWVTVTVRNPGPVTSAVAIHASLAEPGGEDGGRGAGIVTQQERQVRHVTSRRRARAEQRVRLVAAGRGTDRAPQPGSDHLGWARGRKRWLGATPASSRTTRIISFGSNGLVR